MIVDLELLEEMLAGGCVAPHPAPDDFLMLVS
jgi:hypothetical protein